VSTRAKVGSLSVVIPIFNGESWIEPTLARLRAAIAQAPGWHMADVVLVDDGSTDGTPALLDRMAADDPTLRVVHQENRGRFLARRAGLEAAGGEFVLLLDVRVFLDDDALAYLADQVGEHPDRAVWNGHCDIDVRGNPYARFWAAVTFAAWRRYLANPRLVDFGEDDFDLYPKGTGCFFAPRTSLLAAYEAFTTHYDDMRRVNDDTALLRRLAAEHRIFLGPGFACTYHARGSFKQFLNHSHYRGIHFVDGYLRRSSRYAGFIVAFLVATPVGVVALATWPVATVGVGVAGCVVAGVALLALGVPPATAGSFAALLPLFAVVYGAGIWRGVLMAARTRLRRARG